MGQKHKDWTRCLGASLDQYNSIVLGDKIIPSSDIILKVNGLAPDLPEKILIQLPLKQIFSNQPNPGTLPALQTYFFSFKLKKKPSIILEANPPAVSTAPPHPEATPLAASDAQQSPKGVQIEDVLHCCADHLLTAMDSETRQTFRAVSKRCRQIVHAATSTLRQKYKTTQGAPTPPLESIPIPKCPNVRSLDICHFHGPYLQGPFPACVRSLEVSFAGDQRMSSEYTHSSFYEAVRECTELRALTLHGYRVVYPIPPFLTDFSKLESLTLIACLGLVDVSALDNCTTLKTLNLSHCGELMDVSALGSCTNLQKLKLYGCLQLEDVSSLGTCTNMQILNLPHSWALVDVSALGTCANLHTLDLSFGMELKDLSTLGACTDLQKLNLAGSDWLVDVSALGTWTNLQELNLRACEQIVDVSALGNCTNLQTLDLHSCDKLGHLSGLGACANLQTLDLSHCYKLGDVLALGACANMQTLNLSYCSNLVDLSALGACANLQTLDLSHCYKLGDVSALGNCRSLQTLNLSACPIEDDAQHSHDVVQIEDVQAKPSQAILLTSPVHVQAAQHSADIVQIKDVQAKPSQAKPSQAILFTPPVHVQAAQHSPDVVQIEDVARHSPEGVQIEDVLHCCADHLLTAMDLETRQTFRAVSRSCRQMVHAATSTLRQKYSKDTQEAPVPSLESNPIPKCPNVRSLDICHFHGPYLQGPFPACLRSLEVSFASDKRMSNEYTHRSFYEALCECTELRALKLHGYRVMYPIPPFLTGFSKLESLTFIGCEGLVDLSALDNCTNLQTMNLSDCVELMDVMMLVDVQESDLEVAEHSPEGVQIEDVLHCCADHLLTAMDLETRQTFRAVSRSSRQMVHAATSTLRQKYSKDTQEAPVPSLESNPIPKCPNVRSLDICHFHGPYLQGPFPACLRSLEVSFASDKRMSNEYTHRSFYEALRECTELRALKLHGYRVMYPIPPFLTGFSKLESLTFIGCEGLVDLSALDNCTNLQTMNLSDCVELMDVSALGTRPA
eukprot:gene26348-biopygen11299